MKQIRPIICAALIALAMGGEAHAAMLWQAKGAIAHGEQFRNGNRGNGGNNGGDGNRRGNDGGDHWGGGGGWDEDRSDNRASRAKAVGDSRGRVLDVGQERGSIFWVKVSTDHGLVTYLVDTDSGRIVGER